jgi:hypothetical protein
MSAHAGRGLALFLTAALLFAACAAAQSPAPSNTPPDAAPVAGQAPPRPDSNPGAAATGVVAAGPSSPADVDGSAEESDFLSELHFGAWSGNVGFYYYGDRENVSTPATPASALTPAFPATSTNFVNSRALEQITIRNDEFYYIDPGFIDGYLSATLGLTQERQELDGANTSLHGTLGGYDFKATVFRDLPYNGDVYANRSQSFSTEPFGGSTKTVLQTEGIALRLGEDSFLRDMYPDILPYFSAGLEVYQQRQDENSVSAGVGYQDDEIRNVVNLTAHNGTETSDLNFLLRYVDNNNLNYAPNTFTSDEARLSYDEDFGANLANNWSSLLDYYDRRGGYPEQTATVDELLRLTHSDDTWTTYHYYLLQQNTEGVNTGGNSEGGNILGGNVVSQTATFDLHNVLWRNLTTTVEAQALHVKLPTGTQTQDYAQVDWEYARNLPWNGRADASLGGRYQYDGNDVQSGQIQVVDEPHAAPPVLGVDEGFVLANNFVITSSIVMVDARGGSRLVTTVDVDYTVLTQGNQTRIVVLPTSPVIKPNDPLLVSYTYAVPANANLDSRSGWAGAGLDFGWIGLRYRYDETNQTPLTPAAALIADSWRESEGEVNLNGEWGPFQARGVAAVKDYNSTFLAYQDRRLRAFASFLPFNGLSLNFTGLWYRTNYTLPAQRTQGTLERLDLIFQMPIGVTGNIFAFHSTLTDTLLPNDTLSEAGVTLRYNWRKITLSATAQYSRELRGDVRTNDTQLQLSAVRQF